jgi:hypothetical protein
LQLIVKQATERGEIRPGVDSKAVATLIVATIEGALMISRLERTEHALRHAQEILNRYIDTEVAESR